MHCHRKNVLLTCFDDQSSSSEDSGGFKSASEETNESLRHQQLRKCDSRKDSEADSSEEGERGRQHNAFTGGVEDAPKELLAEKLHGSKIETNEFLSKKRKTPGQLLRNQSHDEPPFDPKCRHFKTYLLWRPKQSLPNDTTKISDNDWFLSRHASPPALSQSASLSTSLGLAQNVSAARNRTVAASDRFQLTGRNNIVRDARSSWDGSAKALKEEENMRKYLFFTGSAEQFTYADEEMPSHFTNSVNRSCFGSRQEELQMESAPTARLNEQRLPLQQPDVSVNGRRSKLNFLPRLGRCARSSDPPLRSYYPFRNRILTGNVKKLTEKFERGIARGNNSPLNEDDVESDTNKRFILLLSRLSERVVPLQYLSVDARGDIVRKGSPQTKKLRSTSAAEELGDHLASSSFKRLGRSLTRHDGDLDLLVREGEAVSSRLRNLLTTSLRSPAPSFRRPISTEPPRQVPPGRPSRRTSPSRLHRSDLALDDELKSFKEDFTRSRSLSDIRHQSDRASYRLGGLTSTPVRAGREMVSGSRSQLRDLSAIPPVMDDTDLYHLEEETRGLKEEVQRLENLLSTSRADRDHLCLKYSALSDRVSDEWQDYQSKLQNFHEIQNKQTSIIDRLANKLREYKGRCREMESRLAEGLRSREEAEREIETLSLALSTSEERLRAAEAQHTFDLETALIKLEDEQTRCETLGNQVVSIQEKVVKMEKTLTETMGEKEKLTSTMSKLQEDMKVKETSWNEEARKFNNFYISKHKSLLDLWREVGAVKRSFGKVKDLTSHDLGHLQQNLESCSQQLQSACRSALGNTDIIPASEKNEFMMSNPVDLWARIQDCEKAQFKAETEKVSLKEKINDLTSRVAELHTTLRDRERCIQDLTRRLDDGMTEMEVQETLKEKVRTLETYLVDIAHTVIKDSEQSAIDGDSKSPPAVAFKLSRDHEGVSPDLPQSTVSAVRTALSNRQVQIHDLQLKLSSSRDQLVSLRKQYDSTESSQRALEVNITELRDELEMLSRLKDDVVREKDRLMEDLDAVCAERAILDKANQSLKTQLESVGEDAEKRLRQMVDLEKERAGLVEEKAYLTTKLSKERDESQKLAHNINLLNSELASAQHQVLNLTDSLAKSRLFEEKADAEKDDVREQMRLLERSKIDLESKVSLLQRQEAELKDALEKVEDYNINLGQDKSQLVSRLAALESERVTANTEKVELRAEIERLKDELEAVDDERANLEAAITSLNEKLNIATVEKEKIELELSDVIAERNEIHSHLTNLERTRSSLEADLNTISDALEDRNKLIDQLNQDKEVLTKENAEMEYRLAGVDKEINQLKENLASVKAEKQSLESFASSLEKKWSNNEARRTQLEKENQQLTVDKERINTQMNKLQRELETDLSKLRDSKSGLERKLDEAETEHKKMLTAILDEKEEIIDNLRKEKNDMQSDLEDKLNSTVHLYKQDLEDLEGRKDQELSALRRNVDKLQREREDSALRYEEEKHKSLMMAQQEIASLEEKVSNLQRDLAHYESQVELLRREGSTKADAGRASESVLHTKINQLKEDLHLASINYEKQLKNDKETTEKKIRDLQARIEEMRREHDIDSNALKTDLRLSKEDTMRFQQDLEDAEAKLRDAHEARLAMKKEIDRLTEELRLSEERRASDWQATLKRIDVEKKELQKKLDEKEGKIGVLEATEAKHADLISRMTSQLRELNTMKQDTHREISDLKRKLQVMENEGLSKVQEIESLRQRLCAEEDRHNESRKEASKIKAKHTEYERERENLQTELALLERRLSEMEDHHTAKEQELAANLHEARANEKKLSDEKKNLENYLTNANQQVSDLKVKLSREEGHVEALEQQLSTLDSTKEQLEKKLHTVYASLRTVTRMYQDKGPGSPTARPRKGKIEFEKSLSQAELDGLSFEKINLGEIDPDSIRNELRSLMNQMHQIELERDDAVAKVTTLERQLSDLQESQQKSETRLRDVTRTLSELEEKKRYTEDKLNKSSSQITQHEDALRRKENEIRNLTEELSNVKRKAADLELERNSLHDRLQKLKSSVGRLEVENSEAKERLRASEQRLSLVDDSKGRLETDLNAVKKALNEKQLEIESLKGNKETVSRSLRILEDQNAALKSKIEELKHRLSLASSSEAELKDKLSTVNRSLKEHVTSTSSMQEELSRCHSLMSRNENERRQLEERLVELQSTAGELRRQKDQLSDSKSKLVQDISNLEIKNAELEMTLKSMKGNLGERSSTADELIAKVSRLEQEKSELRHKLGDLERRLAVAQAEKKDYEKLDTRFDKDLVKYLDKDRPLSISERTIHDSSVSGLRIENMELRRKIDELETEKTDLQQKHLKENLDLASEYRKERHGDGERVRRMTAQMETLRQEKERCILRINALEQQINQYRDQIREYRSRSSAVAADVRKVRKSMTESLHSIGTHPRITSSYVDSEIQALSGTRSPVRSSTAVGGRASRRYGSLSPRRRGEQPKRTTFAAS